MRKITLLIFIFVFFVPIVFGQPKIDKVAFEHWVDYANCKYTAAYIETLRNDPKEQGNIKKYDSQIKSKIEKCSYENPLPFKDLSELLRKNGWEATEKKISAKINEKKQKFQGNEMDATLVVDLLKLDGQLANKIQSTIDSLINEVKEKYKLGTPIQEPGTEKKPTQEPTPASAPETPSETTIDSLSSDHSHFWLWLALIVNWLILFFYLFLSRKKGGNPKDLHRELIITSVLGSQRIADQFNKSEKYISNQSINQLNEKIESLKRQIEGLENKKNNVEKRDITEEKISLAKTETDNSKYFKSKNGKVLNNELPGLEGALFKVFNINGNEGKFSYCGGVVNEDYFTDVCSFANNPSDVPKKTQIVTTVPGVVKKDNNNKWEITEKAIIKFM